MSSTFSTNLAIELIGTGDQAGSWGNTTNTNLGTLIEQAISGYVTQAVATGTDTTITIPNGSTGVARNMYIELTGTGGTNTNLIVPANKKLYFIYNNSTGAVTVKVSGQTGISVPQGKKMALVSNGTDIVTAENYIADFGSNSATITTLTGTSANITTLTGTSANITTLTGTSANITTLSGTTATFTSATVTNLALTSLTLSNLSISSANITTLTGTTFGTTATTQLRGASAQITTITATSADITTLTTYSLTISNATTFPNGNANGVMYLNGSKVLTNGSALTFDGTNLGVGTASPGYKLDVNGQIRIQGGNYLRLTTTGTTNLGYLGPYSAIIGSGNATDVLLYNAASGSVYLSTSGGNAILDTSGNLGLGVTPSAWGATSKAIQFPVSAIEDRSNTITIAQNAYFNGTAWKYVGTAVASLASQSGGAHYWYTAASGTAGNTITFTQAMTLDASGNLGVGTTSPSQRINIKGTGTFSILQADDSTGAYNAIYGVDSASGGAIMGTLSNHPAIFRTNNTERARIDTSGNLLVGTTTSGNKLYVAGGASTPTSAVTFSATAMTVNCSLSNVFTTTFTANVTTAPTLSNPSDGQTINWFITQDGTGSRTMTWPTSFKWPGGTAGVLSTAANSVDLLVATYRSSNTTWYATLSKGFA